MKHIIHIMMLLLLILPAHAIDHPFSSFSSYHEDPLSPTLTDNEYPAAIRDLINEKCNGCENVVIVGDDFVVPHYRRDVQLMAGLWFIQNPVTEYLYTDYPYVPTTQRSFEDFTVIGEVLFVKPEMDSEMEAAISNLADAIEDEYGVSVHVIDEASVGCDSFETLRDYTIFAFGDENNNHVISCLPHISSFEDTLYLERNIWSGEYYPLVIVEASDDNFIEVVENLVREDAFHYMEKERISTFRSSILDCENAGYLPATDTLGDVCSGINDCGYEQSWGWCGIDVVMVVIPVGSAAYARVVKKVIDSADEGIWILRKLGDDKVGKFFRPLLDASDEVTEKVVRTANKLKKIKNAETIESLKRIYSKADYTHETHFRYLEEVADVKGADEVVTSWGRQLSNPFGSPEGFVTEFKHATAVKQSGGELLEMSQDFPKNLDNFQIEDLDITFRGEVDLLHKQGSKNIADEVKSFMIDNNLPTDRVTSLKKQIAKLDRYKEMGYVDKVRVVSQGDMTNDEILRFVNDNNIDVEFVIMEVV